MYTRNVLKYLMCIHTVNTYVHNEECAYCVHGGYIYRSANVTDGAIY